MNFTTDDLETILYSLEDIYRVMMIMNWLRNWMAFVIEYKDK